MPSAREYLNDYGNRGPDDTDIRIFILLNQGERFGPIAAQLDMSPASIEKRVHRLQAKRWATADGRLLTFVERQGLLDWERSKYPNTGVKTDAIPEAQNDAARPDRSFGRRPTG